MPDIFKQYLPLQEENEFSRKWNTVTTLEKMLKSFQQLAYEVNDACDAEEDSYDAMILLTGRADELEDVKKGFIL